MERISAIPLSAVTSHLVRRGLMQTDSSAASNNFTTAQVSYRELVVYFLSVKA